MLRKITNGFLNLIFADQAYIFQKIESTEEENRLYNVFARIEKTFQPMRKLVEPTLAVNHHFMVRQVLTDKLQIRGWNVWPNFGQNEVLSGMVYDVLLRVGNSRRDFDLYIYECKNKAPEKADSLNFMLHNVHMLEQAAREMENFTLSDLKPQHTCRVGPEPIQGMVATVT